MASQTTVRRRPRCPNGNLSVYIYELLNAEPECPTSGLAPN